MSTRNEGVELHSPPCDPPSRKGKSLQWEYLSRCTQPSTKNNFRRKFLTRWGFQGEKAERLHLDCEHRLRRAQHKNQEAILAVLSENFCPCSPNQAHYATFSCTLI